MTPLDAHNVLGDHQHGLRSNRSCETQLINTMEHRGTQREYSSKPLKHSIVERILVFKR